MWTESIGCRSKDFRIWSHTPDLSHYDCSVKYVCFIHPIREPTTSSPERSPYEHLRSNWGSQSYYFVLTLKRNVFSPFPRKGTLFCRSFSWSITVSQSHRHRIPSSMLIWCFGLWIDPWSNTSKNSRHDSLNPSNKFFFQKDFPFVHCLNNPSTVWLPSPTVYIK